MNIKTYEKLAANLRQEVADIDRDIERMEARLAELRRERSYKASGLVGIHYEIKREQERLNDN
jgi:hypothetical protein